MIKKLFVFAFVILGLSSCLPDPIESDISKLNKEQAKIIEDYITTNGLTATREDLYNINGDVFPVFKNVELEGDGKGTFISNEAAWVKYTIRDLQNKILETVTQSDSVLIYPGGYAGKILGLSWCSDVFLGKGGKGTFYLPSSLGYGNRPPAGTESNAIVIIDLEVIDRLAEPQQIGWFIKRNNLNNMQVTESGLRIQKFVEMPFDTNNVSLKVKYTGRFMNGLTFDSNASTGGTVFDINNVIPGFGEALKMMTTGEKAMAILPSSIAYGENGSASSGMPPRMALSFEIEIVPQ